MNVDLAKYEIDPATLTNRGHEHMKVSIEEGSLTISIGIGMLAWGIQSNEQNWHHSWRISDIPVFARKMARALEREDEDGTTFVHTMLDSAAAYLMEDGLDEGVEECRPVDPDDCADAYEHRERMHEDVVGFGLESAHAYSEACKETAPIKTPFDPRGNIRVYASQRGPMLRSKIYNFLDANKGNAFEVKAYDDLYEEICDIFLAPEKKT